MGMLAFIALMIVVVLTAIGVIGNVRLYSRGAFEAKQNKGFGRLEKVVLSQEAVAEQDFYSNIGMVDNTMNVYIRKLMLIFLGSLAIAGLLVALIINSLAR